MTDLCRIGVAIPDDLLAKFDRLIELRGYTNRSEAFRDLIRNELVDSFLRFNLSERVAPPVAVDGRPHAVQER